MEGNTEVSQQILITDNATTEVELKLNFCMGTIKSLVLYELDGGLLVQLTVLNMGHYIHVHQDQNISLASAEYLPLNLVIFGSHIQQNSFDTWASTAAETSALIAAVS